jgi:diadenylate cyclase
MVRKSDDAITEVVTADLGVNAQTLDQVLHLAVEIAREGREGRKIGTLFVVGDTERVLKMSKSLILDPLLGHADDLKHIDDPNMRETIKELAQVDGGFIVRDDGVVVSGAQYISASSAGIDLPLGLGARHMAAASVTKYTEAVAVVVSESSIVRLFDNGRLVSEIIPELWMLSRYSAHLKGPGSKHRTQGEVTVVRKMV